MQLTWLLLYFVKPFHVYIGSKGFYLDDDRIFYFVIILLIVQLFFYIFGYKYINKNVSAQQILLYSSIIVLSTLFIWNIASDDLFTYIYRSRLLSKYGVNPYLIPYDKFSSDLFYSSIKTIWSGKTSVYGSAFMIVGSALTYIGGDNLLFNILTFKVFFGLIFIISAYLVYKITNSNKSLYLFAMNPVMIFELVINNHLEAVMIFWLLLGIYYLNKVPTYRNLLLSWGAVLMSVFTKFIILPILPFMFISITRNINGTRNIYKFLLFSGFVTIGLIFVLYLPYWTGFEIFDRLILISQSESSSMSPILSILNRHLTFALSKKISFSLFFVSYLILLFISLFKLKSTKVFYLLSLISIGVLFITSMALFLPWYITTFISLGILYCSNLKKKQIQYLVYLPTFFAIIFYFYLR